MKNGMPTVSDAPKIAVLAGVARSRSVERNRAMITDRAAEIGRYQQRGADVADDCLS